MAHRVEPPEPTRVLIAALGGEGGGVLAGWITNAAIASGLTASRTSIPGVAQRTGATTYYIEMMPVLPGAARPVLALNPAPGQVDVLLASELLEAARMATAGFIAPDRTTLIASTHRVFTVDEKSLGGDGRADSERLVAALGEAAKRTLFADFGAAAEAAGAPVSAILLGALAASGTVPIPVAALREAIRVEGKAVAQNLAGFEAGRALFASDPPPARRAFAEAAAPVSDALLAAIAGLPAAAGGLGPRARAVGCCRETAGRQINPLGTGRKRNKHGSASQPPRDLDSGASVVTDKLARPRHCWRIRGSAGIDGRILPELGELFKPS